MEFSAALGLGQAERVSLFDPEEKMVSKWKYADPLYDILKVLGNFRAECKIHKTRMSWEHLTEAHKGGKQDILDLLRATQVMVDYTLSHKIQLRW